MGGWMLQTFYCKYYSQTRYFFLGWFLKRPSENKKMTSFCLKFSFSLTNKEISPFLSQKKPFGRHSKLTCLFTLIIFSLSVVHGNRTDIFPSNLTLKNFQQLKKNVEKKLQVIFSTLLKGILHCRFPGKAKVGIFALTTKRCKTATH